MCGQQVGQVVECDNVERHPFKSVEEALKLVGEVELGEGQLHRHRKLQRHQHRHERLPQLVAYRERGGAGGAVGLRPC